MVEVVVISLTGVGFWVDQNSLWPCLDAQVAILDFNWKNKIVSLGLVWLDKELQKRNALSSSDFVGIKRWIKV